MDSIHRLKQARFFTGVKVDERDPEQAFLRVSCYARDTVQHVRFSVWVGDTARCVLSIPASEARELARFLGAELDVMDALAV